MIVSRNRILDMPAKSLFKDGFLFIETDKNIYYPGETMECSIQLYLKTEIDHADTVVINIKGKENFKFNSKSKNHRSLQNKREFYNQSFVLCRFAPSYLPSQDYTFQFKFKIPEQTTNSWPASFHMKRDVPDKGELKLHTKYRIQVKLNKVGNQLVHKFNRRFFIAKKPFNPRQNFVEMAQQEVFRVYRCCSAGINVTKVKFERNFYLSDEKIHAKCSVDNSRSSAKCENIICRLIRTIKAYGYVQNNNNQAQQNNRQLVPFEENVVIASQEFPGVPAHHKQNDYQLEISMFLDAVDQKFKLGRKNNKEYKPEDLDFARKGMQPSTVGQIFNCLYTVVVNRTISGVANYPTGVSVLITINPSISQISGFKKIEVPGDWNPKLINMKKQNIQQGPNQNNNNNPNNNQNNNNQQNDPGNNIVLVSQLPYLVQSNLNSQHSKHLGQFKKQGRIQSDNSNNIYDIEIPKEEERKDDSDDEYDATSHLNNEGFH